MCVFLDPFHKLCINYELLNLRKTKKYNFCRPLNNFFFFPSLLSANICKRRHLQISFLSAVNNVKFLSFVTTLKIKSISEIKVENLFLSSETIFTRSVHLTKHLLSWFFNFVSLTSQLYRLLYCNCKGLFINYVTQSGGKGVNPCVMLWSDDRVKWSFWCYWGRGEGVNFETKWCNIISEWPLELFLLPNEIYKNNVMGVRPKPTPLPPYPPTPPVSVM